jgi:hypothetical protein
LILSCATDYKRGPEGGPNDRISPKVVFSSINDTALNMDRNSSVEIKFSEYIDVNSTKNAISISPRSALKKSKILLYDKSVVVKFDGLDEDQTVVITINPTLKDTQGNSLTDSYSLSFSTGEKIDSKNISGAVNGAINKNKIEALNYSKIKVNLYSAVNDSLNLVKDEPEYSTGLSKDYTFDMKNIGSGNYKIIAFNDLNNDSKPQTETEMIGFSTELLNTVKKDSLSLDFSLGYNDDVSPFIKKTAVVENDILKIEFSEELKSGVRYIDSCYVNNIAEPFSEFVTSTDKRNIYAKIKPFSIGDIIKIRIGVIADEFGNIIKEGLRIKTHTVTDTAAYEGFRITGKFPERIAADQILSLTTSRFSNDSLSFQIVQLKDSLIHPLDKGVIFEPYKISIDMKLNNIVPDNYEFRIVKADTTAFAAKLKAEEALGYGSVSGKISGNYDDGLVLICKNVKGDSKAEAVFGSNYKIELIPGKYLCAMISDKISDGIFTADFKKNIYEKAVFHTDTVFVRKNWETADIDFEFK